jgi:hypothetical protein
MSKRSSKSALVTNQARLIVIGSRKGLSFKKRQAVPISAMNPSENDKIILKKLEISFIDNYEELSTIDIILYARKKINELVQLSPNNLQPRNIKLSMKTKVQLIRLIAIIQNKILETIRI